MKKLFTFIVCAIGCALTLASNFPKFEDPDFKERVCDLTGKEAVRYSNEQLQALFNQTRSDLQNLDDSSDELDKALADAEKSLSANNKPFLKGLFGIKLGEDVPDSAELINAPNDDLHTYENDSFDLIKLRFGGDQNKVPGQSLLSNVKKIYLLATPKSDKIAAIELICPYKRKDNALLIAFEGSEGVENAGSEKARQIISSFIDFFRDEYGIDLLHDEEEDKFFGTDYNDIRIVIQSTDENIVVIVCSNKMMEQTKEEFQKTNEKPLLNGLFGLQFEEDVPKGAELILAPDDDLHIYRLDSHSIMQIRNGRHNNKLPEQSLMRHINGYYILATPKSNKIVSINFNCSYKRNPDDAVSVLESYDLKDWETKKLEEIMSALFSFFKNQYDIKIQYNVNCKAYVGNGKNDVRVIIDVNDEDVIVKVYSSKMFEQAKREIL